MITASIGSHRFESGPTYQYNASSGPELNGIIIDPSSTVDYVNALPKVDATPQEIREVAAAGIVRLALEESEPELQERAGELL